MPDAGKRVEIELLKNGKENGNSSPARTDRSILAVRKKMKKLLSLIMACAIMLSIAAAAIAAPSPSQHPEPAPEVIDVTGKDAAKTDKEKMSKDEREAVEAESKAVKKFSAEEALDKAGEKILVAFGKLASNLPEGMKKAFEGLLDDLVRAKQALKKDEAGEINRAFGDRLAEGSRPSAEQPFRAVASEYPASVSIKVDDADDFVGMMLWQGNHFTDSGASVDKESGNVSLELNNPSVFSMVYDQVEAP